MPNNSKMSLPNRQNTTMITNVVKSALAATRFLTAGVSLAVRPRKTGVFATGFMMAKKPMNTDRT